MFKVREGIVVESRRRAQNQKVARAPTSALRRYAIVL